MRRLILSLTIVLFFIWLLPLGIFIKPSQEKIACDGQRAICMCSVHIMKAVPNTSGKIMLSHDSQGASKESSSSGGTGNYYISNNIMLPKFHLQASQCPVPMHMSTLLIIRSIESVPKF